MKKDDVKTFFVIILICSICTIFTLIFSHKGNSEKLAEVEEYSTFFVVSNCINNYIDYNSKNNIEATYSLLSSKYIIKNNLEKSNVLNVIDKYPNNSMIKIKKMRYFELESNYSLYYVNGKIIQNEYEKSNNVVNDFQIIVLLDYENFTYEIYPLKNNDDGKKIIDKIKKENIEKNEYNEIKPTGLISEEKICLLYFNDYIDYLSNDFSTAYNLLTDKTKEKYKTKNMFEEYVKNNQNIFSNQAAKCKMHKIKNKRVYNVIDNNNNKYTFYENSVMNYKVNLIFDNK